MHNGLRSSMRYRLVHTCCCIPRFIFGWHSDSSPLSIIYRFKWKYAVVMVLHAMKVDKMPRKLERYDLSGEWWVHAEKSMIFLLFGKFHALQHKQLELSKPMEFVRKIWHLDDLFIKFDSDYIFHTKYSRNQMAATFCRALFFFPTLVVGVSIDFDLILYVLLRNFATNLVVQLFCWISVFIAVLVKLCSINSQNGSVSQQYYAITALILM